MTCNFVYLFDVCANTIFFCVTGQKPHKVPAQRRRTCNAWVGKADENHNARITLAGVDPQSVRLNVQDNMLSIRAEHKESHECEDIDYLGPEVSCGTLD